MQAHDSQGYAQSYPQSYPQSSLDNTQGNQLGSQPQGFAGSQLQGFAGSGLNGETSQQYIFLPSDPDELVDQLKLLYFEKVGGNDSFLINEQIIAIIDKLLEYECISPSQHQSIRSSTQSNLITACNV